MTATHYVELQSGMVLATENPSLWSEAKRLPRKEGEARHRAHAIAELHKILKPGDTVYTVLRHCSTSGMSRRIDLFAIQENEKVYLSGYAAAAMGEKLSRKPGGGIEVGGCNMDMGFHLVYNLSSTLYPNGFGIFPAGLPPIGATATRRPLSAHEAANMVAGGYKFRGRNGDASGWDAEGGYALKHAWI